MPEVSELVGEFGGRDAVLRLMTYAIRCPKVALAAVGRILPTDFNPTTEQDIQIIWTAAQAYWKQYSSAPSMQFMIDTTGAMLNHLGLREQQFHLNMQQTLQIIYSHNGPWDENYGEELLKAFCAKRFSATLGQIGAIGEGNLQRMSELVTAQFRRLHVTDEPEIDPFDIKTNTPASRPRVPTGFGAVDFLLGGGLSPPESYGILGPTGGGKTLLALQLSTLLASRGHNVLYYTYEQPAIELQPRLLSCAAKVPRRLIDGKSWDQVDSVTQAEIEKAAALCRNRLTLVDRSTEGDNVIEIEDRIKRAIDNDRKPIMVVIDWMWILVSRIVSVQSKRREDRKVQLDLIEKFKSLAAKYDVSFLVLQQLSTEAAKKGGGSKPQWFNSAEAGNFAWLLAYCFAIGTADPYGMCYLVGSKARNNSKSDTVMQLDGEHNRFNWKDADTTYQWDGARKQFVREGDKNKFGDIDEDTQEVVDAEEEMYKAAEGQV